MIFRFGWRPDPHDARDRAFASRLGAEPRAAEAMRLCDLASAVRDQSASSSCVGHAVAEAIEVRQRSDTDDLLTRLSPAALYWHARALDSFADEDGGAYIRSAIRAAKAIGVCREAVWPLDLAKINARPSMQAEIEGVHRFDGAYERISGTGAWRIERVLDALQAGSPVVFGTQVTTAFMRHRGEGVIAAPKPEDRREGGHALCALGFDQRGARIRVLNSWGMEWGDHGWCWLDPEWFSNAETQDVWALITKETAA